MKRKEYVGRVIGRTLLLHPWLLAGVLCTAAGAIVLALLPPLLLGNIVDSLASGEAIPFSLVVLYFILQALTGMAESARECILTVLGQKITHALRSRLMDKYTRLTMHELTGQEPGAVVSRFIGDVDTVENLFTSGIVSMFADSCKIISIVAVIWVRNRGLALILILLVPFLLWFTRYAQKNMLKAQIANRKAVGRASAYVPETVHNIRTIHCLSKENYMEKRYDDAITDSFRAVEKANFYDAIYSPVIMVLNAAVVALVMLLSASGRASLLALFGMSAGTAVSVINYISQIFTPIESLGMEIQTIQSAVAGVHRINDFLHLPERNMAGTWPEEKERIPAAAKEGNGQSSELCICFENVTFSYENADHAALQNLNLTVRKGEQITLAGRTGAGKSTVFKLLLGLYEPQEGRILVNGRDPFLLSEQERRQLFGCVEQSFHMVPGTVAEQVTLFDPSITGDAVRKAVQMVGLDTVIKQLQSGYDTLCTQEMFSEGQWQLLSIARAIAAQPAVLLLDEITASLDAQTEQEVLTALRRSAENRTVISISHREHARMGRVITIS